MIDLQRHCSSADRQQVRLKVIGLGGAGGNALDRIILDGLADGDTVVMNTDAQALASSVASEKVQLGESMTRGLGAGGDPEVGYAAAEESLEEIRGAVEGAQLVFLCVGLGGGTGSGAARLVASLARQLGAFVIAFATMPFSFEGRRRLYQAEEALQALQSVSDVVICFDNDRMGDAVSPRAGIQEAFAVADQTISQSLRAIAALPHQRGIIHLGFDELASALRSGGRGASRCLFGFGEAEGDNRAHDALARALKSPLMEKGRMLEEAHSVLVNVAGGATLTLNEVQILMEEFGRHVSDQTKILFGATVDPRLGQKLGVTLISSIGVAAPAASAAAPAAHAAPAAAPAAPATPHAAAQPPASPSAPTSSSRPRAAAESSEALLAPALAVTAASEASSATPAPLSRRPSSPAQRPRTGAVTNASPPAPAEATPGSAADLAQEFDLHSAAGNSTLPPTDGAAPALPLELPHLEACASLDPCSAQDPQADLLAELPLLGASAVPVDLPPLTTETRPPGPRLPAPPAPTGITAPLGDLELLDASSAAGVRASAAAAAAAKKAAREAKQEQMQFEPVTRGRFEKSEPTIVDGQDLDVPTFLRRNLKVK